MQSIFLRGQKKNRDRMEYEDIHSTGTELGTDTADGAEMPSTASVPTGAWPCERALPDSTVCILSTTNDVTRRYLARSGPAERRTIKKSGRIDRYARSTTDAIEVDRAGGSRHIRAMNCPRERRI